MTEPTSSQLLERLLAKIERAWYERGDRVVVEKLVHEHPEFQKELEEFSLDLVHEFDDDENATPEIVKAEDAVHDWIQREGFDKALSIAATLHEHATPTTSDGELTAHANEDRQAESEQQPGQRQSENWIRFLRLRIGRTVTEIALSLPNVTIEFLSLVSRHSGLVPDHVKIVLARSVEARFGIPVRQSLRCLRRSAPQVRVAMSSRIRPEDDPVTFQDILERSGLDKAQRDFWQRSLEEED